MTSPVLEPEAKKKALTSLLAEQITPSLLNLLKVLADRQRLPALERQRPRCCARRTSIAGLKPGFDSDS